MAKPQPVIKEITSCCVSEAVKPHRSNAAAAALTVLFILGEKTKKKRKQKTSEGPKIIGAAALSSGFLRRLLEEGETSRQRSC